jgi:hypothetical protein
MVRPLCYAGFAKFDKAPRVTAGVRARQRDPLPQLRDRSLVGSDMGAVVLESVITCPNCRHSESETMPTDRCLVVYECTRCKVLLRPYPGECCVFCSFGSMQCPSMQTGFLCHF